MSSNIIIPQWGSIKGLFNGSTKTNFKDGWNPQTNTPNIYTTCVQVGDFVVVQDVGAGNTYSFDFGTKGGIIELSDSDQVVFNGVIFVKNEQFNRDAQEIEMDRLNPSLGSVYTNIITNKNNITVLQATKEPTITSGTTSQYWRGDKTWQTLNKSAVGLPDVDNTSDVNKPISNATQLALNSKEPTIASGATSQYWRGDKTWQSLNKAAVGLSNVDNTSDLNKPISTATQLALNARQLSSEKGQASGYAPLDSASKVPKINVYNTEWGEIVGELDNQSDLRQSLDQKKNIPVPIIYEKWSTPQGTFSGNAIDTTPRQEKVGVRMRLPQGYNDFKSNPTSFVVLELYKQKKRCKRNANNEKIKQITTKGWSMTGQPYAPVIGLNFNSTEISSIFSAQGFGELGLAQNRHMITKIVLSQARIIHKIDNSDFSNCLYYPPVFVGNFDQGSQDVSALVNINDYLLVTDAGYIDQLRMNLLPGDHIYLDEFFNVKHWRPSTVDNTGTIDFEINPTIFFKNPNVQLPVQLDEFNNNSNYRIKTTAVSNSAWGYQRTRRIYFQGSNFHKTDILPCKTHTVLIRFRLGYIIDNKVHFGDASDVLKIKLRRVTTDPNNINKDYFVRWDIL